jgi:GT2 family glycosyltransferase
MNRISLKVTDKLHATIASFIIVNWNGRHLLEDCINSILSQTCLSFEIILVDNASSDTSVQFITERFPMVKIIALAENTGFTGGNIAGLEQAVGNFIILLNNDAVLTDRWLEVMLAELSSDATIGFCSSKIVIAGTDKIDSVGDTFTTAFTGTKMGEYESEKKFTVRRQVPGACAAAVIYKREMLNEIGFLDDDFFLNHEDTDLNMRAWLAGWRCLFVPEAVVYHKVSASIGALSDTSVYYFARNNEWVWLKNVPLKYMICNLPHRILYECASFGYFCLLKGRWRPFLRGKCDALMGAPAILKKRRAVQVLVRLCDAEIYGSLVPLFDYLKKRLKISTN